MAVQQKITPFLWFDTQAEEAAKHYTAIFPNSRIRGVTRYGPGMPMPEGTAMTVDFELDGQRITGLNGGPQFKFTEAVSFVVHCETQAEIDHYWTSLTAGGAESMCGWLKDRFGLSWQIVPTGLGGLLGGPDREGARRAGQALMGMRKLDLAALERAYRGK
jgi:predicted 3-demethylubiquinone-9 3-methyltransferase (glyoxalase superfamily)